MRHSEHLRTPPCHPRLRVLFDLLLFCLVIFVTAPDSAVHAAWAVYGDSWTSATQAQEQVTRVNRVLGEQQASYERATVQGRTYWRVRIGVYATRNEALEARRRAITAGVKEPWMREVSDVELAVQTPSPTPSQTAYADSVRADSLRKVFMDSLARATRRRIDSLGTAAQRQTMDIIEQMRLQITQELVERIEREQARDRSSYVTTAEQSQMTNALIDEMSSRFEVLRDSLRTDRAMRDARDALLPRISGYVAATGIASHDRPAGAGISTSAEVAIPHAQALFEWANDRGGVVLDVRTAGALATELHQAFVTWSFGATGGASRSLGLGLYEMPYGLEPSFTSDLLTCSPSQVSAAIPPPARGLLLVPHDGERVTLSVFPFGRWDEGTQKGLVQLALHHEATRFELTAGGERVRYQNEVAPRRYEFAGMANAVIERKGANWLLGAEANLERRRQPVSGILAVNRRQVDTWGGLALVHRRFSERWGWTLRGDFTTQVTTWTNLAVTAPPREPLARNWTVTSGPIFFLGDRLRARVNYTFDLQEDRAVGTYALERSHHHRFEFGLSHVF